MYVAIVMPPPALLPTSTSNASASAAAPPAPSSRFVAAYERLLQPHLHLLPAVDGHNHTQVIEKLLDHHVAFHDQSKGGRKWGMLACFLSHLDALEYQVEHAIPYQVTLEDDVWLRGQTFLDYIDRCCEKLREASNHTSTTSLTHLQLSRHTEVRLTTLEGARHLLGLVRAVGIRKSIDQQFNDARVMGSRHEVWPLFGMTARSPFRSRPWVLGHSPNSADGHIFKTRKMTWTEVGLLRILTQGRDAVARLPNYGLPRLKPNAPSTFASRRV